jgi:hypothetical protein
MRGEGLNLCEREVGNAVATVKKIASQNNGLRQKLTESREVLR